MRVECSGVFYSSTVPWTGNSEKFDIPFLLDDLFRLFSCSVVVVQESVFQRNTRVIEQDTLTEKEKALRVPRAVNIG